MCETWAGVTPPPQLSPDWSLWCLLASCSAWHAPGCTWLHLAAPARGGKAPQPTPGTTTCSVPILAGCRYVLAACGSIVYVHVHPLYQTDPRAACLASKAAPAPAPAPLNHALPNFNPSSPLHRIQASTAQKICFASQTHLQPTSSHRVTSPQHPQALSA